MILFKAECSECKTELQAVLQPLVGDIVVKVDPCPICLDDIENLENECNKAENKADALDSENDILREERDKLEDHIAELEEELEKINK